jgi:hypothetical protein
MPLPFGLQSRDLPGAVVSAVAALLSAAFAWKSAQATKANANRSIYVDGQKFLIEVCKQLVAEPVLWCLYDDNPCGASLSILPTNRSCRPSSEPSHIFTSICSRSS